MRIFGSGFHSPCRAGRSSAQQADLHIWKQLRIGLPSGCAAEGGRPYPRLHVEVVSVFGSLVLRLCASLVHLVSNRDKKGRLTWTSAAHRVIEHEFLAIVDMNVAICCIACRSIRASIERHYHERQRVLACVCRIACEICTDGARLPLDSAL